MIYPDYPWLVPPDWLRIFPLIWAGKSRVSIDLGIGITVTKPLPNHWGLVSPNGVKGFCHHCHSWCPGVKLVPGHQLC